MTTNSTTGKDSQESITLQNALQPLPDTQTNMQATSSPQSHCCPEDHDIPSVQLYSRPKEHAPAATDLDVGFAWGQPMKIDPGRFSNRPKPSKTLLQTVESSRNETPSTILTGPGRNPGEQTICEDGDAFQTAGPNMPTPVPDPQGTLLNPPRLSHILDPTAHSIAQDHASTHAYHHQAVVGKSDTPSDAAAARAARKKSPFDGFQPARQIAHQKAPLPTPNIAATMPSQGQLVESHYNKPCANTTQDRSDPNTVPQPLDQNHTHIPSQKLRTSLRNDISVSSDRPARQLPQHGSANLGSANRSMRDDQAQSTRVNTPRTRPRNTPATGSNTKRKRPAQDSIASSGSRFSNQHSSAQQQETPSLQPRQRSPQNRLREMFIKNLAAHKGEVAGYLNDKWSDMEQQMDQQIHGIISDLKSKLKKQEAETSRHQKHNRSKDSKIQRLEEDHERLVSMLHASDSELQERAAKFSKLDEKCRKYKEYLNSAISEQQELYKATKAKCDGAIAQMRAEESKRQLSQEQERKKAESARERLNQLVKTTISEYKKKESELNDTVRFLSQKIEERDADLLRERENAQILQQHNVSINSIKDTLKSFEAKVDEAMTKAVEVASCRDTQEEPNREEMHMKLDKIVGHLRSLDERTYSKDSVSKELQGLNEKAVVSILEKLEPMLDTQLQTKADLDHLCEGFEKYVDQLWAALENRQVVLEERIEQRQAENEQQISILQNELEITQQECAKQKQLVDTLQAAVSEHQSEIEELLGEIEELERAQIDSLAQSELFEQVQDDHARLKEEATAKAANISELETKLEESRSTLATEVKKHQQGTEELRKHLEQRLAEAQAGQAHAVEAAQRDAMLQMNELRADMEKRLAQATEERAKVRNELEAAKRQIATMDDECSSSSEQIRTLQQELETCRLETVQSKEVANQKEMEQQNTREQQSKLLEDLQSQLAIADKKYNNLVKNAKSYDSAAYMVWQNVKQWTSDYAGIKEACVELEQTKDANPDQINPKFQPLVQIQRLQKAVAQYCRTQKVAAELLSGGIFSETAAFNAAEQSMSMSHPPATEPQETESQNSMIDIVDDLRRVIIRSPAGNAPSPMPPSVQIEQQRRRKAYPPKPILKLASETQAHEAEDEAPQVLLGRWHSIGKAFRGIDKHGKPVDPASSNLNRGSYNRVVAGSQDPLMLPVVENGLLRNVKSTDGVAKQETMTERKKRKERSEQESEASRKRARTAIQRQRASLSTPRSSPPEPDASSALDVEHVPRAPRKTVHRLVADEPLTSPARSSQPSPVRSSQVSRDNSQHRTATGTSARRPSLEGRVISSKYGPYLNSSQDPLSPFFQFRHSKRGHEDSQDSITRSQDVDVEARSQASLHCFKRHITMGP